MKPSFHETHFSRSVNYWNLIWWLEFEFLWEFSSITDSTYYYYSHYSVSLISGIMLISIILKFYTLPSLRAFYKQSVRYAISFGISNKHWHLSYIYQIIAAKIYGFVLCRPMSKCQHFIVNNGVIFSEVYATISGRCQKIL